MAIGTVSTDDPQLSLLRRRLRAWYRQLARKLPWRGTRDPYRVWVSEIMLQQTQVESVKPYYKRFMARFPNVLSLAQAEESTVLRLWEGLGYYRRARQLHRAAQQIVAEHEGVIPSDAEGLQRLPGIGRYTAGAILSIACDQRQPILEANTVRLFSRLLAYQGDPHGTSGQKQLWQFAERILPHAHCGEFNQALMELGSQICTPRTPQCATCPLALLCPTRSAGLQSTIPRPKKKPTFEDRREVAVIVQRNGSVLLRQCGPSERWAGLWDFPRFEKPATPGELSERVLKVSGVRMGSAVHFTTLKHGVTRFRITLECVTADATGGRILAGGKVRWVRPTELENYPLCTTGRKISRLLAAST